MTPQEHDEPIHAKNAEMIILFFLSKDRNP